VIVDERERRSGVPDVLKDLGARIEFRLLDVGDYVVGETAIERKTVDDYVSSLFSGRLFEQAGRLTESYAAPLIIVEGDLQASLERLSRPRVFWGSMMSLVLQYNVRPFFTLNAEQTAELIFTCALHVSSKRGSAPPVIVKKPRISSQAQMQLLVVESLPMIGPRLARKLLERFGTVRRVFEASLTELAVRGGIGRARAQRVASILDLPYRRGPVVEHQSSLRPEE
jgi:DNA excision repair protein ERCC-4